MCHSSDQLAVLIKPIATNRYAYFFDHRGLRMTIITEMEMGFSLFSYLPALIAIVGAIIAAIILDWTRNGS
jgi:hypothetical protein